MGRARPWLRDDEEEPPSLAPVSPSFSMRSFCAARRLRRGGKAFGRTCATAGSLAMGYHPYCSTSAPVNAGKRLSIRVKSAERPPRRGTERRERGGGRELQTHGQRQREWKVCVCGGGVADTEVRLSLRRGQRQ